jgi:hypothetical protein
MALVLAQICYLLIKCQTFSIISCSPKLSWFGTNRPPEASITLQHHLSDPYIDDIQWSGGNSYGFMTANGISFGSDLLMKCQTFNQLQSKIGMVWPQEPA